MNLLPSVQAYIRERIAQLETRESYPQSAIEELEMVNTLCEGLQQQMAILDKLAEDILKPKPKG